MRTALIVAAREFRQIVATRSYWVALLLVPIALAIQPLLLRDIDTDADDTQTVMLADASGILGPAITSAFQLDEERRTLSALARYAQRYHLGRADAKALWSRGDRLFSDAEVRAFVDAGGLAHAQQALARVAPGRPPFEPPAPLYRLLPAPAAMLHAPRRLAALVDVPARGGIPPVDYAVYIPAAIGSAPGAVEVWSSDPPPPTLLAPIRRALAADLVDRRLHAPGAAAIALEDAASARVALHMVTPDADGAASPILPMLVCYLLLLVLTVSGSWMLQGLVEERSSKLLEAMLACVSPGELMAGKLVGTIATGLSMLAIWAICGAAAGWLGQGEQAATARAALTPLANPAVALTTAYFFIAGYAMMAATFLAIGAVSDSIRDAQSYLSPVMLVVAAPVAVLLGTLAHHPDAPLVRVMQWLPPYLPFAQLARIGSGTSPREMIGPALVLAITVLLEIRLLGRIFQAKLLAAGTRFRPLAAVAGLFRRPA